MTGSCRTGCHDDVSLPTLTLTQLTASVLSYRDRFGIRVFDKGSPLRSEQTLVELAQAERSLPRYPAVSLKTTSSLAIRRLLGTPSVIVVRLR